jgi:beta-galactosidase
MSITSHRGSSWKFDLAHGTLISWQRRHKDSNTLSPNILTSPLVFDIYRAQTDNDRGCAFGRNWLDRCLHQAKQHPISTSWQKHPDGSSVEITAKSRIAPPALNWSLEITATYHFTRQNHMHIRARAKPTGELLPRAWGRLGLVTALKGCGRVAWYGRGPGEAYRDRKLSQRVGNWEVDVGELATRYEFPQENGNRTDVRWVEFFGRMQMEETGPARDDGRPSGNGYSDDDGVRLLRARYGDFEGASFSALPYAARDLDEAGHPFELDERERRDVVVHLDWMHHGLGTGSCGPETLPEYTLDAGREYEVEVVLD